MAVLPKRMTLFVFLALLMFMHQVQAIQTKFRSIHVPPGSRNVSAPSSSASPESPMIDCGVACAERCKSHNRRHRVCRGECEICCASCNCVPSGTYGNYDTCPCYAGLSTRNNQPLCP